MNDNFSPRNLAVNDEQKRLDKQRAAWKILMNACHECGIDAIGFANIIGVSHGYAMKYFRQGYGDMKFNDEQYVRLARATSRTVNFWKSLFETC